MIVCFSAVDGPVAPLSHGVPTAFVSCEPGLPDRPASPCVEIRADEEGAAREAAEALLSLGHRRIAVVVGPLGHRVSERWRAGISSAMRAGGLAAAADLVLVDPAGEGLSADMFDRSCPLRPTAVVCLDPVAVQTAYAAAAAGGLRIPADVSVVARHYAGESLPRLQPAPAPASIGVGVTDLMRLAVQVLLDARRQESGLAAASGVVLARAGAVGGPSMAAAPEARPS